jgi:3',5'-cyclic AMP phosphodiesterase CpdA
MRTLRILWVDDDWDQPSLQLLADALVDELAAMGVHANFDKVLPKECINRLAFEEEKYFLIITDHVFERHTPPSNGAQIVEALSSRMRVIPPIVLLTRFLRDPEYYGITDNQRLRFYRKFTKEPASVGPLAKSIQLLSKAPPLNMLILSDIHCGFAGRRHDARAKAFYDKFIGELSGYVASNWKIDHVIVTGDLAWRKQDDDLADARDLLVEIMRSVGLSSPAALQFCIGNHDLNLRNTTNPLDHYRRFLNSLRSTNPHYVERYIAYQSKIKELGGLSAQEQSLYTDHDPNNNVMFASLNSCAASVRADDPTMLAVKGEIGIAQWAALETSTADVGHEGSLRIALMHHPLFATPGGHYDDEPPITDQAQAFHRLTKLGFQIAIHGHSHFACMYEQRMQVLNPSARSDRMSRLLVIAAPTLAAEPSATSPSRQYMVLSLGTRDVDSGKRDVTLHTRSYNEHNSQWSDGQRVAQGHFTVE